MSGGDWKPFESESHDRGAEGGDDKNRFRLRSLLQWADRTLLHCWDCSGRTEPARQGVKEKKTSKGKKVQERAPAARWDQRDGCNESAGSRGHDTPVYIRLLLWDYHMFFLT